MRSGGKKRHDGRPIGVIDAETDPFVYGEVPEPFIWGFYDGYRYKTFTDVGAMIDWLKDQEMIIYAHNGGKFDYHLKGFLDHLEPFQSIMMINGRLASFTIGKCEFRDSFNILPDKLSNMGCKLEIDYDKLRRENRMRHMPEILRYLKQDCETLYSLVTEFVRAYGLHLTLASAAMAQWRKISGMPSPRNKDQRLFDDLKPFYYGGRVECFQKGIIEKPFHLADIKSAYPFAMLHDHPYGLGYVTDWNVGVQAKVDPQAFYDLTADHDGCFPVRTPKGLSFAPATGARVTVTGWELAAALETGAATIIRIHRRISFGASLNFKKYVDHFYAIKESSPPGSFQRLFAKFMLNSCYGKFGSNPLEYFNYMIIEKSDWAASNAEGYQLAAEVGQWFVVKKPLEGYELGFYNLATAASITGFVRSYLWRHIHGIKQAGGSLLYCDTDSLAFTVPGVVPLPIGKALGQWEMEGTKGGGFVRAAIAGKKMYAFRMANGLFKTACKGVRLTPEEIFHVASGKTVTYRSDAPSFSLKHGAKFVTRQAKATI